MSSAEEVKGFARAYIGGEKTQYRRQKIREALYALSGERLRVTCETCYVEAIFKILKLMEKAPCRYKLKKGAVLQAFGNADMFCTSANLTDEKAEWHLKNTKGAASLFVDLPPDAPTYGNTEIVKADAPVINEPAVKDTTVVNKEKPKATTKKRKR